MAKLIYSMLASLDGYTADERGNFDWAMPDEEVHSFVNDLERPIGTYLYGRRMYQVMSVWESDEIVTGEPACVQEFAAIWRAADKVVYSSSLASVSTPRTRLERAFESDAIRRLKQTAGADISVGGPTLAARALEAGLVDECALFVVPVIVGGGTPSLPKRLRLDLELLDERRFGNGMVFLRYRVRE